MDANPLLSGNQLEAKVEALLLESQGMLPLKKSIQQGDSCDVYIYRCHRFEALIDYLSDHVQVGTLTTQHNIIKIFLKREQFGGEGVFTEVPIAGGFLLDWVFHDRAYELKTMKNVQWQKITRVISTHYAEILQRTALKDVWELAFFGKRRPPKATNTPICYYYLVVIEVTAAKTSPKPKEKQKIIKEAQRLVNMTVAQVQEEDGIEEEGILFPVKNVLEANY